MAPSGHMKASVMIVHLTTSHASAHAVQKGPEYMYENCSTYLLHRAACPPASSTYAPDDQAASRFPWQNSAIPQHAGGVSRYKKLLVLLIVPDLANYNQHCSVAARL
jgi:hypothetical protein